jgi:hypothetical protein
VGRNTGKQFLSASVPLFDVGWNIGTIFYRHQSLCLMWDEILELYFIDTSPPVSCGTNGLHPFRYVVEVDYRGGLGKERYLEKKTGRMNILRLQPFATLYAGTS